MECELEKGVAGCRHQERAEGCAKAALAARWQEIQEKLAGMRKILLGTDKPLFTFAGWLPPSNKYTLVFDAPIYADGRLVVTGILNAALWAASKQVDNYGRCWVSNCVHERVGGERRLGMLFTGPSVFRIKICLDGRCYTRVTAPRKYGDRGAHSVPWRPLYVKRVSGWHRLRIYVQTLDLCCKSCTGTGTKYRGYDWWYGVTACGLFGFYIDAGKIGPEIEIPARLSTCMSKPEDIAIATINGPGKYSVKIADQEMEIEVGKQKTIVIPNSSLELRDYEIPVSVSPAEGALPEPFTAAPAETCIDRHRAITAVVPDLGLPSYRLLGYRDMDAYRPRLAGLRGASGTVHLRVLWPSPGIEAAVETLEGLPLDTVEAPVIVGNEGTCAGVFSVDGARVELEPGRQRTVRLEYTVPAGDKRVGVAATATLANGVEASSSTSILLRGVRYVRFSGGEVYARGPGRARLFLAGLVEPWLRAVPVRAVVPAYVVELDLGYEEVSVARYERLDYARLKSDSEWALLLGSRRAARGRDAEYVSPSAALLAPLFRLSSSAVLG